MDISRVDLNPVSMKSASFAQSCICPTPKKKQKNCRS